MIAMRIVLMAIIAMLVSACESTTTLTTRFPGTVVVASGPSVVYYHGHPYYRSGEEGRWVYTPVSTYVYPVSHVHPATPVYLGSARERNQQRRYENQVYGHHHVPNPVPVPVPVPHHGGHRYDPNHVHAPHSPTHGDHDSARARNAQRRHDNQVHGHHHSAPTPAPSAGHGHGHGQPQHTHTSGSTAKERNDQRRREGRNRD